MARYKAKYVEDSSNPEQGREFTYSFNEDNANLAEDAALQLLELLKRKYLDLRYSGLEEV